MIAALDLIKLAQFHSYKMDISLQYKFRLVISRNWVTVFPFVTLPCRQLSDKVTFKYFISWNNSFEIQGNEDKL